MNLLQTMFTNDIRQVLYKYVKMYGIITDTLKSEYKVSILQVT